MSDPRVEELRDRASNGDIAAMQELARLNDPDYLAAFRAACIDVLGEDPLGDVWWETGDRVQHVPRPTPPERGPLQ